MREKYFELMADPAVITAILDEGSAQARALAAKKIKALRAVIGMD